MMASIRSSNVTLDLCDVQRLLVILPSWIGDGVMATPLLRVLRKTLPLKATVVGYLRPGLDDVFNGTGLLDEMVVGRPNGLAGPWREGRRLRALQCDACILLPNSFRMGLTARLSGIPIRLGYARQGRGWLLSHGLGSPMPEGWTEPISAVDYYLHLGTAFGGSPTDRSLSLGWSADQEKQARSILGRCNLTPDDPYVVLNPGANRVDKRWPAEHFASLAQHLAKAHGLKVLINGAPTENAVVSLVVRDGGDAVIGLADLGGSLGSLKPICGWSRLVVTNDTGTRHVAVGAMNHAGNENQTTAMASLSGVVSLFGPTDPRWAEIDCPFETQIRGSGGSMASISVEQVIRACDDRLATDA